MKDSVLKQFFIIGSGTLINLFLGLFTTPIITRLVDPVEYGQLSIYNMYSNIAVMVMCLGLDQALVRFYYEDRNPCYKRALLFNCIILPVFFSTSISFLVILLSIFKVVQFEFDTFVIIMLCLFTIVQIIYRFSLLIIRLEYKSKIYSILNISQKTLYVAGSLLLLVLTEFNHLRVLIVCTTLSFTINMIISIIVQRDNWNISKIGLDNCNLKKKELLRYAYPFIISMGITTLFQAIDKIFLNLFYSYKEVGVYASAMTLVHIFAIIQTAFNTLWSPMAIEHYSNNKNDKLFYQKGNQVITIIMFGIGISLILVKDIFAILLGEKYREAAFILPFLIFNPIMYTISETTVGGLVFLKKSKLQVVVAIGACISNIIGNAILVPKLGCRGAAISTGISYIVFFTLRTVLSNYYYFVDFKLRKFYILTIIVSLYALYNTFIYFNIGTLIGYIICIIAMFILYNDVITWCIDYLLKKYQKV